MGDHPSPHVPMPPPPSIAKSQLPMLYYSLVIIGTAAVVLVFYSLILRWCADAPYRGSGHRARSSPGTNSKPSVENFNINYVHSFKYKKDGEDEGKEFECAVCLSVFEEAEQLKQLPNCKHSFHANCIDMWLYSHMDCPLCRTSVEPPRHVDTDHFP